MRCLLALACILTSTASFAQNPPYLGDWTTQTTACPRDSREYGESIVVIRPQTLTFYESRCTVGSVERQGPAAWMITATCTGEGETSRDKLPLRLSADGKTMTLNGATWHRCRR